MFLDKYGKELTIFPSKLSRVSKWNHQLNTPSKPGRQRDAVLQLYRENGWKGVEAHFIKQRGLKYKIKKLLYSIQNRISEK